MKIYYIVSHAGYCSRTTSEKLSEPNDATRSQFAKYMYIW